MKISNKFRKRILNTVSEAFAEIITQWECYDSPPEIWQEHERDRWDELSSLVDLTQKKLDKTLLDQPRNPKKKNQSVYQVRDKDDNSRGIVRKQSVFNE